MINNNMKKLKNELIYRLKATPEQALKIISHKDMPNQRCATLVARVEKLSSIPEINKEKLLQIILDDPNYIMYGFQKFYKKLQNQSQNNKELKLNMES